MEDHPTFLATCTCNKAFTDLAHLSRHQKICSKGKKPLAGALMLAKEVYRRKKMRTCTSDHQVASQNTADSPLESEDLNTQTTYDALPSNASIPVANNETDCSNPLPLAQRRTRRLHRQPPVRFRDVLPEPISPPLFCESDFDSEPGCFSCFTETDPTSTTPTVPTPEVPVPPSHRVLQTQRNDFGLYRIYNCQTVPSHGPNDPPSVVHPTRRLNGTHAGNPFHPYPNKNSLLLGDWYWNQGSHKSRKSFKQLLEIIRSPDFCTDDIRDTKWVAIDRKLGNEGQEEANGSSGWTQTAVTISVPFHQRCQHPGPKPYSVSDFHFRPLLSVIRDSLSNPNHHSQFHYEPYELRWHPPHKTASVRLYGELFTSRSFLEAHEQLQVSPGEPGCDLPRRILGLMFWSDSTHLTTFGELKLWPVYMYFGNESKYTRGQPSSKLCMHVAYFQSLPDEFNDFATDHTGTKPPGNSFFTHCNRELFHAQWLELLDNDFVTAYEHRMVITCGDGTDRRLYPRIFTYSADYPEKVLIANVRNLGGCPCPHCTIPKSRIELVATGHDMLQRGLLSRSDSEERRDKVSMARNLIYQQNYAVDNTRVEDILKSESLVPTINAFSARLGHTGFDFFRMLVVDFLHEFELGIWKALFLHLLRILDSQRGSGIAELDRRYRQVPTFGRDTIRRFRKNVSEMKRTTARDFEDLLQCAIPVFEGLLPEPHNHSVLRLLFMLCHWHGLAKLRLHTDETLDIMEAVTIQLANLLRDFKSATCAAFQTKELQKEAQSRMRRDARQSSAMARPPGSQACTSRRPKVFNLQTYKLHALGDYTAHIRMYGTTDSFSTQIGELEHRTSKGRFIRTSRKKYVSQLTAIERRQDRIQWIRAQIPSVLRADEGLLEDILKCHHYIGSSYNHPEDLMPFAQRNSDDPAAKNFILDLKSHLLRRIVEIHHRLPSFDESDSASQAPVIGDLDSMTDSERLLAVSHVIIHKNRIYRHKTFWVNFTTYDLRRETDIIKPKSDHCDVMMLSHGETNDHPFRYARVIGIFHTDVIYTGIGSRDYRERPVECLWVRWFEKLEEPAGWPQSALEALKFMPMSAPGAFGFVNPDDVLRGCHLIPRFSAGGLRSDGISVSRIAEDAKDWKNYYVNRFVDRDMLLRYHWGEAVGHVYTHQWRNTEAAVNFSYGRWSSSTTSATDTGGSSAEVTVTPGQVGSPDDEKEVEDWQSSVEEFEEEVEDSSEEDDDSPNSDFSCDSHDSELGYL